MEEQEEEEEQEEYDEGSSLVPENKNISPFAFDETDTKSTSAAKENAKREASSAVCIFRNNFSNFRI